MVEKCLGRDVSGRKVSGREGSGREKSWNHIDFQADLDLLALTPGVIYAVKNNSRAIFFDIRDSTFEVVSGKMRKFFGDNIKSIAVTLDKVTVHHTSYTLIMTYFFWRGKLHVVLNELNILNLDDYDSEGTARMVVNSLISTLCYRRTQQQG